MGMLLTESQRKWVSFLKEAARKKPPTKDIRPEVPVNAAELVPDNLIKVMGELFMSVKTSVEEDMSRFSVVILKPYKNSSIKENRKIIVPFFFQNYSSNLT